MRHMAVLEFGRGRPRLLANVIGYVWARLVLAFSTANDRVRPRLYGSGRLAPFHDHCDVTVDRGGRDQVSFAVGRFDLLGFVVTAAAIFLDGSNGSGVAGR